MKGDNLKRANKSLQRLQTSRAAHVIASIVDAAAGVIARLVAQPPPRRTEEETEQEKKDREYWLIHSMREKEGTAEEVRQIWQAQGLRLDDKPHALDSILA